MKKLSVTVVGTPAGQGFRRQRTMTQNTTEEALTWVSVASHVLLLNPATYVRHLTGRCHARKRNVTYVRHLTVLRHAKKRNVTHVVKLTG